MGIFSSPTMVRVKVLGIRTGMESKAFSNVNFGIYTLLVEYSNGARDIIEVDRLSDLKKYANYMEMD